MAVFNTFYMFIYGILMTPIIENEKFLLAFNIRMESYLMTIFFYTLLYYFSLDVPIRLFIKWMERKAEYEADEYSV